MLPVEAKIGWVVAWLIAPGVSMQNFYKMAVALLTLVFGLLRYSASRADQVTPAPNTLRRWLAALLRIIDDRRRKFLAQTRSVTVQFDESQRDKQQRVSVFVTVLSEPRGEVQRFMLSLHTAESGESHSIAKKVADILLQHGTPPTVELNFCTDSCSVMVGVHHSSFEYFQTHWKGPVHHISCVLHQQSLGTKSSFESSVGTGSAILSCSLLNLGYSLGWLQREHPLLFARLWMLFVNLLRKIQAGMIAKFPCV